MMPTCHLVLGLPRSGTSCVAGILHHLGVFMGERFLPTTRMNPKGFFHDLDFEIAWSEGGIDELIVKRQALGMAWGVNTRRSINAPKIAIAVPAKVIVTSRPLRATKASCDRWFKTSDFIDKAASELRQAVKAMQLPTLTVDFDLTLERPQETVVAIAEFVGLSVTQQAIDFVDPTLRNFR